MQILAINLLEDIYFDEDNCRFLSLMELHIQINEKKSIFNVSCVSSIHREFWELKHFVLISGEELTKNEFFSDLRLLLSEDLSLFTSLFSTDYSTLIKELVDKNDSFIVENLSVSSAPVYHPINDCLNASFTFDLNFKETVEPLTVELISKGESNEWELTQFFFLNGKKEIAYSSLVRFYLLRNLERLTKLIEESAEELIFNLTQKPKLKFVDFSISSIQYEKNSLQTWKVKFSVPNKKKRTTLFITQNKEKINFNLFDKQMKWDSDIWYPGWKDDLISYLHYKLPKWKA